MVYIDFIKKTLGLKSMNHGTSHWLKQRMSSLILLPLTFFFIFPFGKQLGMSHAEIVELYSSPVRSFLSIAFLGVTLIHLQQGFQVVIEDYIHTDRRRKLMLSLNSLVFWSLSAIIVYSFGSIVFV